MWIVKMDILELKCCEANFKKKHPQDHNIVQNKIFKEQNMAML